MWVHGEVTARASRRCAMPRDWRSATETAIPTPICTVCTKSVLLETHPDVVRRFVERAGRLEVVAGESHVAASNEHGQVDDIGHRLGRQASKAESVEADAPECLPSGDTLAPVARAAGASSRQPSVAIAAGYWSGERLANREAPESTLTGPCTACRRAHDGRRCIPPRPEPGTRQAPSPRQLVRSRLARR